MAVGARGGEALAKRLTEIAARVSQPATLRVGFLESARYPNGQQVAYIAAIQEFGATINREAGETTIYRKISERTGDFLRGGRFVKRAKSNFATTHYVGAHVITIPPRPFFRRMIKANAPTWPADIAKLLKATQFDAQETMRRMGEKIVKQLRKSIQDLVDPPLAPSTIRGKGFSKPLIGGARDSGKGGTMYNNVGMEVIT